MATQTISQDADHKRLLAGIKAEKQLAFYLNRAFGKNEQVALIHNLRLVDADQPNPDGSAGVAQMDHLLIHRHGLFVIESKSVVGQVIVRSDGAGGDEWERTWGRYKQGMPSPIRQAQRQGEFLREYLRPNAEQLLGKLPLGTRTLAKVLAGSDQRGFKCIPVQVIAAISDQGRINRQGGWQPPQKPLPSFVCKADLVASKIEQELASHKKHGGFMGGDGDNHGGWDMKADEVHRVAAFLNERNQAKPLPDLTGMVIETPPTMMEPDVPSIDKPVCETLPKRNEATCKACSGSKLNALWGRYGYYWQCLDCQTNTTMPVVCHVCGAQGHRGKGVKVSKKQNTYTRVCEHCGTKHVLWRQ